MHRLINLAILQAALYGAIDWFSDAFAYGSNKHDRPILLMVGLFAASFILYLLSIRVAVTTKVTARLSWAIFGFAILFRGLLLPTEMIQEIDIYRYLWDGAATARGVNPYRYSPAHVLATAPADDLPSDLQELVKLCKNSPELAEILRRIHFAQFPTIYPPLSQALFALGDVLTPGGTSVDGRVLILKGLLVLFDLGVVGLLWLILRRLAWHPGWVIAYAWCPLALKEFANSGHLDSIAVFFTTASIWCVVELCATPQRGWTKTFLVVGGVALALGIGAKLYPLILLPVLVAPIAAKLSARHVGSYVAVTLLCASLLIAPMLLTKPAAIAVEPPEQSEQAAPLPVPPEEILQETGLKAFLTNWEMNDFFFMLLFENLRPSEPHLERPHVWFAVTPNSWREASIVPVAKRLRIDLGAAAFLVTRATTACVFLAIAWFFAWKAYRQADASCFLEATFLTLAWFWLLAPTQNPWYWTWALPLLPFARGRTWYAVSGLSLAYYCRFWLQYHCGDSFVMGTPYQGVQFFDFVVTWLAYAPWLAWLAISAYLRGRAKNPALTTKTPSAA